jgi:hypothetical protein
MSGGRSRSGGKPCCGTTASGRWLRAGPPLRPGGTAATRQHRRAEGLFGRETRQSHSRPSPPSRYRPPTSRKERFGEARLGVMADDLDLPATDDDVREVGEGAVLTRGPPEDGAAARAAREGLALSDEPRLHAVSLGQQLAAREDGDPAGPADVGEEAAEGGGETRTERAELRGSNQARPRGSSAAPAARGVTPGGLRDWRRR